MEFADILINERVEKRKNAEGEDCWIDDVNFQVVPDEELLGEWQSVAFVSDLAEFDSQKIDSNLSLKKIKVVDNDKILVMNDDEYVPSCWKYTKNVFIDMMGLVASRYVIKNINDVLHLMFEWKSGDYMIRGAKASYYVMKKV